MISEAAFMDNVLSKIGLFILCIQNFNLSCKHKIMLGPGSHPIKYLQVHWCKWSSPTWELVISTQVSSKILN